MTLPPKLEKLLDNWPAKIVSLIAAIFVYAFYQISSLETRYFVIPLEINQEAGMIATSVSDSSIRVSIRGNISDITQLESKDFSAYADLDRYIQEGAEIVPVQLNLSDNVRILQDIEIKIEPESVEVTLEKELAEYVPVNIHYAGGTAHGYEIASVKATPPLIKIKGPESLVNNVSAMDTDVILFNELTQDSSFETELLDINSKLTVYQNGPILIQVEVVPTEMSRTINNLSIEAKIPDNDLDFIIENTTGTCTVYGDQLDVEKYSPSRGFLFIDCTAIDSAGEYDIPVQYRTLNNLNVDSIGPETIHVTVTEKIEEVQETAEE